MKRLKIILFLNFLFPFALLAQKQMSFTDAFEIALKNSPNIRQARFNLERSQELLNAQNASLKSRFNLVVEPITYSRDRQFNDFFSTWNTSEIKSSSGLFTIAQPIILTDGTLALRNHFSWRDAYSEFQGMRSKTYSNNLYLSYDQPIFTYNRTRLALEDVKLDLENARLNYQIQELVLEQRVAQFFYNAIQNRMSLQVAEEEYINRQASFEIIKNKVDAGLVAQEQLFQAELDLTSSRSQVQNSKVALANSLDELKRLLGIPLSEEIDVVANVSLDSVDVDMQKAIDHGLQNRLELRQRDIDMNIAKANLVRSAATNEFKGNISLVYGIIGNDEKIANIYEVPTQNQNIRVSLEIPIWDWGEQTSRIKAAEASIKGSKLSLAEEKKDIIIGIRQAFRNFENQAIQIDLADQNVKIAQLTYDINLERYKNGDLTSMDLNLFQNQLSSKKIGQVNAQINYKLALLDLKIESLWDFEKNKAVLIKNKLD